MQEGFIELSEFEVRTEKAIAAKTRSELLQLVEDLPGRFRAQFDEAIRSDASAGRLPSNSVVVPHAITDALGPDLALTASGDVVTPWGSFRLSATSWSVMPAVRESSTVPAWAITVALLGFFLTFWIYGAGFLFLFFFAYREQSLTGHMTVVLSVGGNQYPFYRAVHSVNDVDHVNRWVDRAVRASVAPRAWH